MLPPELHLLATQTALIVVDLQVDFCSPQGKSAKSSHPVTDMLLLPSRIEKVVRRLSDLGVFVVFTKAIVDEQTMPWNLKLFRQVMGVNPPVRRGTGGEELCEMKIPAGSVIVEKPHFDAFAHTMLSGELLSRGVRNLLVSGVRTEICVDATARRASAEGFNTIILRDLVATRDANRRGRAFLRPKRGSRPIARSRFGDECLHGS